MRHLSKFLIKLLIGIIFIAQTAPGCATDAIEAPPKPQPQEPITWENASLRLLFIGNSLTYTNNLPGLVEMIGQEAGMSIATRSFTTGGFSLEDHWARGVQNEIANAAPTLVIMQQGPSSLPESQAHLRSWAIRFSQVIRAAEAEPAMLMVWPGSNRAFAFSDVFDSYRNAATAIDGRFFPAGEAFRRSYADHGLKPYSADNFHPSPLGSIITALTILRSLNPEVLVGLPGEISSEESSVPPVDLQERKDVVLGLVDTVVREHGF